MKKLEKFGKIIQYNVSENGTWLIVTDGPYTWLYLTKDLSISSNEDLKKLSKKYKVEPNYVGKKHMFDLLNHFGCKESVGVFKKKETV